MSEYLGLSASTIASGGSDYPHDPSDFIRCEKLLRARPGLRERRFPELAEQMPQWAGLIAHWDTIAAVIEFEVPGAFGHDPHGRAPGAYALMRMAIDGRLPR